MAWGESKVWQRVTLQSDFYRKLLVDAAERPARNSKRRRLVKPDEMPWELSPHGLLKHMVNEQLNTRAESIDIYMQVIPPGSRSGRHRHFAEEAFYVVEGAGYDLHWDCDVDSDQSGWRWIVPDKPQRFEWKAGDVVYIPPATIHQHVNAGSDKPGPVIRSGHEDGKVHALYNRCRHRGAVVCRQERGHSNFFRCRYHNWVYANNGDLIGMSQSTGYPDDFDRSAYGLVPVSRIANYRGLIFISLSEVGPTFDEHLAPVRKYVDAWLGRSPVEQLEVLLPPHRSEYPGNWKLQAENGYDGYHGNYVHLSWQRVLQLSKESTVEEVQKYRQESAARGLSRGHGLLERRGSLHV